MEERILQDIKKQYGSLTKPDYTFVKKNQKQKYYRELIELINANYFVKDITDFNDDVSYVLLLDGLLTIYVSLVGHYAVVTKKNVFIDERNVPDKLKKILSEKNFILLRKEIVEQKINFNAFNTEANNTSIFHALFSDLTIPWSVYKN